VALLDGDACVCGWEKKGEATCWIAGIGNDGNRSLQMMVNSRTPDLAIHVRASAS